MISQHAQRVAIEDDEASGLTIWSFGSTVQQRITDEVRRADPTGQRKFRVRVLVDIVPVAVSLPQPPEPLAP